MDKPIGMRNLTNTCFINSLLQSIYSLNLLRDIALSEVPASSGFDLLDSPALRVWLEEGYNEQLKLTCHFLNTLRDAWKSTKSPIIPIEMLKAMASKYSQYNDYGQQDSHEFLRQLFDAMRMEELDLIYSLNPHLKQVLNRKQKKLQPHHYQSLTPTTFVDRLCEGMVVNVIICASCKQIYHVYEPFLDISLALQDQHEKAPKRRGFRQSIRENLLGSNKEGVNARKDELTVEDVVLSDTEENDNEEGGESEREQTNTQSQPQPTKSKRFSFRNSFSLGSSSTPKSSIRRASGLAPFPPPSPSSSPQMGSSPSQLAPPPSSSSSSLGRRVSKRISRGGSGGEEAFQSSPTAANAGASEEDTTRRSRRTIEDKIYTQKLFGDLSTPSSTPTPHSLSMTELGSEMASGGAGANGNANASPSDKDKSNNSSKNSGFKDGPTVNGSNAQNGVLAALRQAPPKPSSDTTKDGSGNANATVNGESESEPMSTGPTNGTTTSTTSHSSSATPKSGIEEAFERYAGIETLQNENEFHCHGCWKMQNEVHVEMIRRYKDSKSRSRSGGIGRSGSRSRSRNGRNGSASSSASPDKGRPAALGMAPLHEGERLDDQEKEYKNENESESDKERVEESEAENEDNDVDADDEDEEEIDEKDWRAFYGDTVAYIPRQKQVVGTKALRRSLIAIAPPVLVLHLKRFGSVGGFALSKIFDNITFPTLLDIGAYIAPERPKQTSQSQSQSQSQSNLPDDIDPTTTEDFKRLAELAYPVNSTRYRLRSTVNHCGRTMISGHYTSFASRERRDVDKDENTDEEGNRDDLQWYWASDETIREKTEEEFLQESFKNDDQNVYVLVYERI
ncbi:hypothetical protein E3P92_00503 [Wallemia ichthyophaga]|uniref:ubiquitinyl hydrolase 1 n=1 Tax=Wallemia ichthyophaga TaxID=245174 RepID=A0A4T0GQ50_WALIC|nr:hypothetical protein E3P95_00561 [Wallemia ichthyophaga]TIB04112.1 hypothetical protein E3P94_00709 [Wallemia ichthyophaga]TIB13202.1 hypothetical protein E3P90_01747 [Wallemia ichthyophaga]TIB14942.1 hypothetical protein E3P93_01497 [Wallemia ichthyophaga]TIB18680.1 hypothetical protein E3P92_00503 [Wallemia ichthyophaga]